VLSIMMLQEVEIPVVDSSKATTAVKA